MRDIQVLDQHTIDKIAAGEVVERPASVIKELLENAIDAGATAITAEIRDGGISFLRITDNGGGIAADQMRTAFFRHATSKIRQVEDLFSITSLGFRGEALSSISAVARVECISRTPDALTGIRYCIEGGEEKDYEEIGAPQGTTFIVRDLFYNTPARSKFLKTPMAEGNKAASVVEELALSHPDISFKFIQNGQNKLYTSGNGNTRELVYQIYGKDAVRELIPFELKTELMEVTGFLGKPAAARGNRNFENYFVNGRYVKSQLIAKAIEDGYHGFLMNHRYPVTLLYIRMDGDRVDVNVHPSKMELRFSNQDEIRQSLCLAIQNALMQKETVPHVSAGKEKEPSPSPRTEMARSLRAASLPEPFEERRRSRAGLSYSFPEASGRPDREAAGRMRSSLTAASLSDVSAVAEDQVYPDDGQEEKAPVQETLFAGEDRLLPQKSRPHYRIIGQVFDTYWMIEYRDSLYIIDQHAAHEKILYEKMMRDYESKKIHSQMLYPAIILNLSRAESDLLERHAASFAALGYELESFGGYSWKINAVPSNLYSVATDQLFVEILGQLESAGEASSRMIADRLASMSCKSAVKGNHRMSQAEVSALIDELLAAENPYHCPHGRPTIVAMTRYEMDKKFKRIVN